MTRARHQGRNKRVRRHSMLVTALGALVATLMLATGGVGPIQAYFSDTLAASSSAKAGTLGVRIVDLEIDGLSDTTAINLTDAKDHQLTFTVTNSGTSPWTGNLTLFDFFRMYGNVDLGEKGVVLVSSDATPVIAADTSDSVVISDLVENDAVIATGQAAGLSPIALAAGESKSFTLTISVDTDSLTVSDGGTTHVVNGYTVTDVKLVFGVRADATGTTAGGRATGWTGTDHPSADAIAQIQVNTPPVLVDKSAGKNLNPFIGLVTDLDQTAPDTTPQMHDAFLRSLVTATDTQEGNLTSAITYDATFAAVAGEWSATYNVRDTPGAAATPLTLGGEVWNFTQVETSYEHSLAIDSRGRVWGWGDNVSSSVAGDGSTADVQTPRLVPGMIGKGTAVDVAVGQQTAYVVMADGTLYVWGSNDHGQVGDGTTSPRTTPKVITFPGNVGIDDVSSFEHSVAAVADNGAVYAWGEGTWGALGTGTTTDVHSPVQLAGVSDASEIDMGRYGGIIRTNGNRARVFGSDWHGQQGDGSAVNTSTPMKPFLVPSLTGVQQVEAGYDYMLALTANGSVFGWGVNTNFRAVPNLGAGQDILSPTKVTGLPSDIVDINAGYDFSNVVTSGGKVYGWGWGSYDSTFTGDDVQQNSPTLSALVADAAAITGTYDDTLVLNQSGSMIYGRGDNSDGALGTGNTTDSYDRNIPAAKISLVNINAN